MANNKGPSISIAADTKEAQKGIQDGIIEPLEDARDVIADLATDSKKLDKLESGMEDAAKETKKMRDELDKLDRTVKDTGNSGKKIGDNFKEGTDKAKEGLTEFKDEANSTAREAGASFDGSAESIVDAFQEVAANAFAGFGPAGAVAGLALAAGIGLGVKAFQDSEQAAQELKDKIAQLAEEMIDYNGVVGDVSLEYLTDQLRELATQTDDSKITLKEFADVAEKTGLPISDLAQAYAGNSDELERQLALIDETIRASAAKYETDKEGYWVEEEKRNSLIQTREWLFEVKKATDEAAQAEQDAINAGLPAMQARADMVNMLNDAYDQAAGNVDAYVNKETGLFDTAAYITAMQARETALANYQTQLASAALTPEAKAFLNEQGAEAAALMLSGYTSGDQATKDELNRIWTEAGKEGSGAADEQIKNTFKAPYEAKVEFDIDKDKADKDIANILKRRQLEVMVTYVGRDGKPVD